MRTQTVEQRVARYGLRASARDERMRSECGSNEPVITRALN
jgi:hypothetical protein